MQRVDDITASQHRLRAKDPRAAMQASLREIRAKLAHNTVLKPEFEYELLAMFVRNELSARVTLPLLAVIFSLASMFWAPVIQASVWLATVISAKFFMIAACRQFLALPRNEVNVEQVAAQVRLARAGQRHHLGRHGRGRAGRGRRRLARVHAGLADRPARHPHDVRVRGDDDPLRRHHSHDAGRRRRAC